MTAIDELIRIFPNTIRTRLNGINLKPDMLREIRLRANRYAYFRYENRVNYLLDKGGLGDSSNNLYIVKPSDVKETMEYVSNYSMYAYEEELKQGFITIAGGHRVGISGKVILQDNEIKTIKHISCINIRFSHEIKGCAESVIPMITRGTGIYTTMIISPPCCGKTTLLRDIIRIISNKGVNISVVDERSEIAGSYNGIPQNDTGKNTDILDCCPKSIGILQMLRSMGPDIIAVDEIGLKEDIDAINYSMVSGCSILCTVHGESYEGLKSKPVMRELIEKKLIERYIVLTNRPVIGMVKHILDADGNVISKN